MAMGELALLCREPALSLHEVRTGQHGRVEGLAEQHSNSRGHCRVRAHRGIGQGCHGDRFHKFFVAKDHCIVVALGIPGLDRAMCRVGVVMWVWSCGSQVSTDRTDICTLSATNLFQRCPAP